MKQTILDAHMHLPYDIAAFADKRRLLLKEMHIHQIDKAIVISDSALESTIGSLQDCVALFAKDTAISIVGGISPFFAFAQQLQFLETCLQEKRIVGIKLYCGHEAFHLYDPLLDPVYDLARTYQVPLLYHSEGHTSPFACLASASIAVKQHPDITFVCCHCHYPNIKNCFDAYKDTANIYFDMSSIADEPLLRPQMKAELESFLRTHPDRVMFGSDYASCKIEDHTSFALSLAVDAQTQNKLLYETACRLYSLS